MSGRLRRQVGGSTPPWPTRDIRRGRRRVAGRPRDGAVAQLGEHRLCMAGVGGSNPPGSTSPEGGLSNGGGCGTLGFGLED